jgi:hypothetical protein
MQFDPVAYAVRLRKLHRAGLITHAQYAVGDAILWSCRPTGRDATQVSYDRLAELAHVGRSTAVAAVKRLRALGILAWQKTRLRVVWSLGVASRQGRNIYRLIAAPRTESDHWPTDRKQVRKQGCIGKISPALSAGLAALAARIAANQGVPAPG